MEGLAASQDSNAFQEGMVYVRGDNVFAGYLVPRTRTSQERIERVTDSEGWLATGDIGYQDEGGRLHLTDRLLGTKRAGAWGCTRLIGQHVHHQFHQIDLSKIEARLAAAVPEIAQLFVSGRVAETHAEVGMGQLGELVGFIIINRRPFLRWIANHLHLPHDHLSHSRQLVDRLLGPQDQAGPIMRGLQLAEDDEWEMVNDLHHRHHHQLARDPPSADPAGILISHSHPFSFHDMKKIALNHHPMDHLDQICQDPQVLKSFLLYLGRKGKAVGLKLNEMPKAIHLSVHEFEAHHEHDSMGGVDEKGKSVATVACSPATTPVSHDHDHAHDDEKEGQDCINMFLSLHTKNSHLIRHFL